VRFSASNLFGAIVPLALALGIANCSGGGMQTTPQTTVGTIRKVSLAAESPRPAGAFVDSIGVNIHLAEATPYGNNLSTLLSQIEALGIHHVRDGMNVGQTYLCSDAQEFAAKGIHFDYITEITSQPSDYANWAACVGSAIEAFEAPNEYDISHPQSDSNWPATLVAYQKQFYASVKGNSSTAALPVIGPSLTTSSAFADVGDLSAYENFGNMHDYFDGRNPETTGYGGGGYGSLAYNISAAQQASKSRPIDSTETGFAISTATDPEAPYVTNITAGAYTPRLLFDQFNAGIPRTWYYEFYDDGSAPFNAFGLVNGSTLAPRWSYWALKNLLTVINDSAIALPNATPLMWSLNGSTANVGQTLLEKADGTYFIVLWVDLPSDDPTTGDAYTIAPQAVTVDLGQTPTSATAYTYDSRFNFNPTKITPSTAINLTLTNTVTVLSLTF
jgi:hypothetical protein